VLIVSTIYSQEKRRPILSPIYLGFCYRCEATNQLLKAMILGHPIALDPPPEQAAHLRRACGTARFADNWGLAEWRRRREAGEKPAAVQCGWNAHRKAELAWTYEVTKCASGQAIMAVGTAFAKFFRDCKKPRKRRRFRYPRCDKKARNESFALCNDQFTMSGKQVRIAKLGFVRMQRRVSAEHTGDRNAAINLRKRATAAAESTRRDITPLPAFLRMSASVADEPRIETERTCAHIYTLTH
jgi:transposase